ncbi:MAG: recombinase family protein [Clostridia bacterium]
MPKRSPSTGTQGACAYGVLAEQGTSEGRKENTAESVQVVQNYGFKILAQQEYCGDIINFKTCSKSFKNKTRYANPEDKWAIFKNVHEPIIDRETFEQVQNFIGKTRRRNPKPENWSAICSAICSTAPIAEKAVV